jgi:hypothetical protein
MLYQEPPTTLEVTRSVQIIAYVCVRLISSLVILALIWQTIKHYRSQVLPISRAPFLLAFLVAVFTATVSLILLEPRNDIGCNVAHPSLGIDTLFVVGAVAVCISRRHFCFCTTDLI